MARILVVDDEPEARMLVERILAGAGHEVSSVADGLAAVAAVKRQKPDLLVLDLNLPKIDGFEVCRQIKADPEVAATPVVMITAAYGTVQDAKRGLQLGAVEYVVKPFAAQVLIHNVDRLLRRAAGR